MEKVKVHNYHISLEWTGNLGDGTQSYAAYSRSHDINGKEKSSKIHMSSDPAFRGEKERYNPEELLLASLSSCHMLWYLHLCSTNNVTVVSYRDCPTAKMEEKKDGSGKIIGATLLPEIEITESNKLNLAFQLHAKANELCFIANSVNFKVAHSAKIIVKK